MTRHHPLRNRPSKLWSHGRGRLDTIGEISFLVAAHSIDISRELIIVPYEARMLVARESYGPSGGRSRILPTSAESLDLVRFHQGKAIKILIKTKRIVQSVSICKKRSSFITFGPVLTCVIGPQNARWTCQATYQLSIEALVSADRKVLVSHFSHELMLVDDTKATSIRKEVGNVLSRFIHEQLMELGNELGDRQPIVKDELLLLTTFSSA